jgi:[acyl-carrier-protein] S-malonyltransferase
MKNNKTMNGYVFPGQGAQFVGIGKDLYETSAEGKRLFLLANEILGFEITKIMFYGTEEELKQTKITQPAIFIHSVIKTKIATEFKPDGVAGHSLGEFSALVAAQVLSYEDALRLVYKRALAMQEACEITPSTMAAILGLEDSIIEEVCEKTPGIVVPANYNSPGQLVISGETNAVELACAELKNRGAKRALILPVGGAFHSPLMEPAKQKLAEAIEKVTFHKPICPVYQNVSTTAVMQVDEIKKNLLNQLTLPVKWTQSIQNMVKDGFTHFIEVGGNGKTLQGLIKKIDSSVDSSSF